MDLLKLFQRYKKIATDTRKLQAGDLFFALKGENFDGNGYAAQALEKGAAAVILDNEQFYQPNDERYILVPNVLKSLQDLGREYRRTLSIPIIGITGSNGKTTTKELIASVLKTEKQTFATSGNFNNHIGVPLSLLSIRSTDEIAVIEMGANQPDDIKELAEIAEPTHGVITNIGKAHLEKLKNIEGVKTVKKQLFDFLREHKGTVFVNCADENVQDSAKGIFHQVSLGSSDSLFNYHLLHQSQEGMELELTYRNWEKPEIFRTQLTGEYNCMNILAAVAIGSHFGISLENLKKGIFNYVPTNQRSQIVKQGNYTICLDAYNANPSSMKASVLNFFSQYPQAKKAVILGDMFELGEESKAEHSKLGEIVEAHQPDLSIFVGKEMRYAASALSQCKHYENVEALQAEISALLEEHKITHVLLKGSRGMAMERLLPKIC
ncbi:MAG: UDP-N-acetylmuramoyl-tripeptide--D-alanyl-D-alanine ligase [Bacteroidia bacterium]